MELLDELGRTVELAKAVLDMMKDSGRGFAPTNPVGFQPLIIIGDFSVWPRDKDLHGDRCQECGSGDGVSMMVVRGPMAFEASAPERHFCSMACFWKWARDQVKERGRGRGVEAELKWTDKAPPGN